MTHTEFRSFIRHIYEAAGSELQRIIKRKTRLALMAAIRQSKKFMYGAQTQYELLRNTLDRLEPVEDGKLHPSAGTLHADVFPLDNYELIFNDYYNTLEHNGCFIPDSFQHWVRLSNEEMLNIFEDIFFSETPFLLSDKVFTLRLYIPSNVYTWNSGWIPKMARSILEDRAFENTVFLADALQDVQYENQTIINHLLKENIHVYGCAVLEALANK